VISLIVHVSRVWQSSIESSGWTSPPRKWQYESCGTVLWKYAL